MTRSVQDDIERDDRRSRHWRRGHWWADECGPFAEAGETLQFPGD